MELVLLDEHRGTVEALLAIKDRLRHDFLLLGCDLITDFPVTRFIERARLSEAVAVALLASPRAVCFGQQPKESTEPKHRLSEEGRIVVGLDGERRRALAWMHQDDLDEGQMSLPMALLARHPHVRLHTSLTDVHCYLLRRSLLSSTDTAGDLLSGLFSVRDELIPRLVRRQFGASEHHCCEVLIATGGYCVRTNTLSTLAEAGKQLARLAGIAGVRLTSQAAEVGVKTQIGSDSMIGDQSKVGDKSAIKRTVIGSFVSIGKNVKISNSVVMDYAVVEDAVKLEGCIVGSKAVVREKCYLKDCDVGIEFAVERDTTLKGELLGTSRQMYLDGN